MHLAALRTLGVRHVPSAQAVVVRQAAPGPPRYGYTDAHRRHEPEQTCPRCLTDAEWALVQDVFEQAGSGGLPPEIRRRTLVDACCYGVRAGGAWRMLPTHFPRWQNVHRTFRRWSEQGNFERMHERLGEQWRQRLRHAQPSSC
ncbi:transposase [Xanthomonas theicola]|uniref:transposase n=1 Tax=Xanthomonas theicola TaxID=56464 RepID=UPI003613B782